jgi:hypothetical protein
MEEISIPRMLNVNFKDIPSAISGRGQSEKLVAVLEEGGKDIEWPENWWQFWK